MDQTVTVVDLESPDDVALADRMKLGRDQIVTELRKTIVGQEETINQILLSLFVGGNSLIVGVPGLAKTLLIYTLARVVDLKFNRIQFTPDLMPSDITGTDIIQEDAATGRRQMTFAPGPIFANIVLADEINRTPPKTQSALLEAMQEHRVTIQGRTYKLDEPFYVFATQNPIELEGTYPLPEAQLDRFFYKLLVQYSGRDELRKIMDMTTTGHKVDIRPVIDGPTIIKHQQLIRRVVIAPHVQDYAIRVTLATHPSGMFAIPMTNQFLRVGASPRAAQAITLASKVRALLDGRFHVSFKDVKEVAIPAMRHRIILNFEGEAEGITTDMVLEKILAETPTAMEDQMATAGAR